MMYGTFIIYCVSAVIVCCLSSTDHGTAATKAVDTVSDIHPMRSALQISTMANYTRFA